MKKSHLASSLAFGVLALSSAANVADIAGASSNSQYITTGESETAPGYADLGIPLFGFAIDHLKGGLDDATHTTYLSGANSDTWAEFADNAVGINNYDDSSINLLKGRLKADFATATLTESMSTSNFSKWISIGTATINSDVTGIGTAEGLFDYSTQLADGNVSAQLYNGMFDIAGLIDFEETQYDTAFSGSKNQLLFIS